MDDPKHLAIARKYLGTVEIVGPRHSPIIMGWIARLGAHRLGITVTDDESPWCGTFMAQVMTEAGYVTPPIAVRASSWDKYGVATDLRLGAICVKKRKGGCHVFLAVGISADRKIVYGLGGNQGNKVSIAPVIATEIYAVRAPSLAASAAAPLPIMAAGGKVVSEE